MIIFITDTKTRVYIVQQSTTGEELIYMVSANVPNYPICRIRLAHGFSGFDRNIHKTMIELGLSNECTLDLSYRHGSCNIDRPCVCGREESKSRNKNPQDPDM